MAVDQYKTLTYIMVGEEKKEPGMMVSRADLLAAGQTEDNIKQLLDTGAISDDPNAELPAEHQVVESPPLEMTNGDGDKTHIRASEKAKGESS